MERGGAASKPEAMQRYLAVDDDGRGLRATWRPAQGMTNLSLWRDDVCVETFHLSTEQMGELIAFLATGLATAVPARAALRVVAPHEQPELPSQAWRAGVRRGCETTARVLEATARRLRRPQQD